MAALLAAHLAEEPARIEVLRRLLAHMLWADARVGESLEGAPDATREARELYAHVLGAEQIWLARILGTEPGPVWPSPEAAALARLRAEVRDGYESLLAEITDDELGLSIAYVNSAGAPFESTVEEILYHVFLHGAYHRGQVALSLRKAGAEPAATDYIAFARGAPAATRADSDGRAADRGQDAPDVAGDR